MRRDDGSCSFWYGEGKTFSAERCLVSCVISRDVRCVRERGVDGV